MERRLKLHERLKDSKLNKLTVKQGGGINVTLHLKTDIINENVEMPDKVLTMLENYADKMEREKNEKKTREPIEKPEIPPKSSNVPLIEKPEIPSQPLNVPPIEPTEVPIFSSPPIPLLEPLTTETDPKNDQDSLTELCRLCGLKFSNSKSLYEHVTRVHGGKGLFKTPNLADFQNLTSNSTTNNNTNDLDSNIDDYYSDTDDMSSELSFNNKKKGSSGPNIAIRVAKVAYYSSKNKRDNNNSALLKTTFPNGIRCNFFSQERLPLKSCKIRIKLDNELKQNDLEFLSQSNRLVSVNKIDRNTVITSFKNDNLNQKNIPNDQQIRDFFKSLLVYIPSSVTNRLEEVVKANDVKDELLIRKIHNSILDERQFGITLFNLKKKLNDM
jgi:hypothetical protein